MNFAVIGAGGIAKVNAQALLQTKRANICGIFSCTQAKAWTLRDAVNPDAAVYNRMSVC